MPGALDTVEALATSQGPLRLRRAWPGGPTTVSLEGTVSLEYVDQRGRVVAGQWLTDPDTLVRVAAATPSPGAVVPGTRVLLHHQGADRRLPALRGLLAEPGARLVSHRPERRAVVARRDGTYVKVVRPGRSQALLDASLRLQSLALGAFVVPEALEHRAGDGVVVWSGLAGPTLHELPAGGRRDWCEAWGAAGRAVRALHRGTTAGAPAHTADDERRAARHWTDPAQRLGLLPVVDVAPALLALAEGPTGPTGLLHRDLHDKQVVVTGGPVGLLDADTLAVGELALDVANLLVHLQLRVDQEVMSAGAAAAAADAFIEALSPAAATLLRVPAYAQATRLRLAGVYAFRPAWSELARRLLWVALDGSPAPVAP